MEDLKLAAYAEIQKIAVGLDGCDAGNRLSIREARYRACARAIRSARAMRSFMARGWCHPEGRQCLSSPPLLALAAR